MRGGAHLLYLLYLQYPGEAGEGAAGSVPAGRVVVRNAKRDDDEAGRRRRVLLCISSLGEKKRRRCPPPSDGRELTPRVERVGAHVRAGPQALEEEGRVGEDRRCELEVGGVAEAEPQQPAERVGSLRQRRHRRRVTKHEQVHWRRGAVGRRACETRSARGRARSRSRTQLLPDTAEHGPLARRPGIVGRHQAARAGPEMLEEGRAGAHGRLGRLERARLLNVDPQQLEHRRRVIRELCRFRRFRRRRHSPIPGPCAPFATRLGRGWPHPPLRKRPWRALKGRADGAR